MTRDGRRAKSPAPDWTKRIVQKHDSLAYRMVV